MSTVRELLAEGRRALRRAAFGPSPREAGLLLGRVLGVREASLLAHDERVVEPPDATAFRALLARRLAGEPVAYLFGEREFFGRSFAVDARVLIPRPETEHLVEAALALPLPAQPRIVDLGTGSGCLAVTLALELPEARVVATDLRLGPLAVADANRRRHGVADRVALLASDWSTALDLGRVDALVANPPYVDPAVAPELSPEVREHEPAAALFAPEAGLGEIRRLLGLARRTLRPGAPVLVEIGHGQAAAVVDLATALGYRRPRASRDLAGRERIVQMERGGPESAL